MTDYKTLNAAVREEGGKGYARRLRRDGKIPAVFYGKGLQARGLIIDSREMKKLLFTDGGSHGLFQLQIEGETDPKVVLFKEYQIDPMKRSIIHADFYQVDITQRLELDVPLNLVGEPVGVEKGGLLQQIRHEVTIKALPTNIPDSFEVDVTNLDLGESLHVEELKAPEGVEVVFDVNFTLATVIAPKGAAAEEEEEEEAVEGAEA
jgi:large subunit ribosomal protein L25